MPCTARKRCGAVDSVSPEVYPSDVLNPQSSAMNQFSAMNLLDPTIETEEEPIDFAPRPVNLRGLRIGLIENTKKNAEAVLRKLAEKLEALHGMTTEVLVHKSQRAPRKEGQIAA